MRPWLTRTGLVLLAIVLVPACGGGGGGGGSSGTPPSISNLSLSPAGAYRIPQGGFAEIFGVFDFVDPDGDIVTLTLTITDRTGETISETGPIEDMAGATSGSVIGWLDFNAGEANDYTIHLFVTDARGFVSNALTADFPVRDYPWVSKTPMPTPRSDFFSAALEGRLYVMGGALPGTGTPGTPTDAVERYDPATQAWSPGTPLPAPAAGLFAATIDGTIHVVGNAVHWVYDPATAAWTNRNTTSLPYQAGVAALNGRLLVVGGYRESFYLDTVQVYDASYDLWSAGPPVSLPRRDLRAAALGTRVYAVGGYRPGWLPDPGYLAQTEAFDPGTGLWTGRSPMFEARTLFGCAAADGLLYAIGGEDGLRALDTVEAYDPAAEAWRPKAPLPLPLGRLEASTIDGKIYAVASGSLLEYTPGNDLTGTSAPAPKTAPARAGPGRDAVGSTSRWSVLR